MIYFTIYCQLTTMPLLYHYHILVLMHNAQAARTSVWYLVVKSLNK